MIHKAANIVAQNLSWKDKNWGGSFMKWVCMMQQPGVANSSYKERPQRSQKPTTLWGSENILWIDETVSHPICQGLTDDCKVLFMKSGGGGMMVWSFLNFRFEEDVTL